MYLLNNESVVPLTRIINSTMRKIDDLEWEGDFEKADIEIKFLDHLFDLEAKGDIFYPLF